MREMAAKSAPVKPRSNEKKAPAPAKERPSVKASPAADKPPEKAAGKAAGKAKEKAAPDLAAPPSRPAPGKAAAKGAAKAPANKPAPATVTRDVRPSARGGDPGEAALAGLASRLAALPPERVIAPRTDPRAAATFVLSTLAERLKDADLVKRLRTLPATELDPAMMTDLLPAAQAVLYTQTRLAVTEAQQPGPRLPTELIDQASALRDRMLRVVEYHLSDSVEHEKEIASIKAGHGYTDLAEDLNRLATLYRAEGKNLREDRRHYQSGDAVAAVQVSHRIQRELRPAEADPKVREQAWRAFAVLLELYEEVAAACRYILRKSHGEALFPSLITAGKARRRSSADPAPSPPPGPNS